MNASPAPRLLVPLSIFVLGLAILAGALVYVLGSSSRPTGSGSTAIGGPFTLVDQTGKEVTDKTFAGAPFLVFFGFTHCPDICPTTLYEMSEVFQAMGKDAKVRALLITVDPERDTPEALKSYISSFDPRIVGLSGTPEQIDAVAKAYKAYAKRVPLKDGDYTMDHTAVVYLMDRDGRFVQVFNLKRPPAEAADELRRYL